MLFCDYYTDVNTGSGDGFTFCNANNQCECQVAAEGNGYLECCTTPYPPSDNRDDYGKGGCNPNCKSMHFHPSIASPFLLPL